MNSSIHKPTVLVLGSTGQTGRLIIEELNREPGSVHLRLSSRKHKEVERLCLDGHEAVYLDLDDPHCFGLALAGVEGFTCSPATQWICSCRARRL